MKRTVYVGGLDEQAGFPAKTLAGACCVLFPGRLSLKALRTAAQVVSVFMSS